MGPHSGSGKRDTKVTTYLELFIVRSASKYAPNILRAVDLQMVFQKLVDGPLIVNLVWHPMEAVIPMFQDRLLQGDALAFFKICGLDADKRHTFVVPFFHHSKMEITGCQIDRLRSRQKEIKLLVSDYKLDLSSCVLATYLFPAAKNEISQNPVGQYHHHMIVVFKWDQRSIFQLG